MGRDWDGMVMLKERVQSKKIKLFIFTAGRSALGWKFSAQENVNVITSTKKCTSTQEISKPFFFCRTMHMNGILGLGLILKLLKKKFCQMLKHAQNEFYLYFLRK